MWNGLKYMAIGLILIVAYAQPARSQEVSAVVEPAPLRVALPLAQQSADGAGCLNINAVTDLGARAYAAHLKSRFGTKIVLCLTDTPAQSAEMATQGEVDMALVTAETYQSRRAEWRSLMSMRSLKNVGRAPAVIFARADDVSTTLETLKLEDIGYISKKRSILHIGVPQRVLEDYGVGAPVEPAASQLFSTVQDVFTAVLAGEVKAGAIESSGWGRECAVLEKDKNLCAPFKKLIYDRPQADEAFIVPRDLDKERLYRLIGVHIALHFEAKDAFDWLSQGRGSEFEPTEPDALADKSALTAVTE